jgi:hypothetical protein
MGKILAKRLTSFSRRSSAGSDAGASALCEDLDLCQKRPNI